MSKKTGYEFWNDVLNKPIYVAAPMVDMSELSFRKLCRQHGVQLCFTPMLHSQQFLQDSLYRSDCFSTSFDDKPLIVQFCANNPNVFVEASRLVSHQCNGIDLNLGCPQAIAKKGHYGAFLQNEWDLIHSIIRKAADELPIPVTCKMRILPGSSIRSVEYAKMLENAGCSVLTVHGRTIFQKGHNTGLASWDVIKDIKNSVKIPIIANGNILTYDDVQACLKYTGADAVMSAEALLHNPALFSGTNPPVWEIIKDYLDLAEKYNTPLRIARNHMYRILYLCLYQDDGLRRSLEDSKSYCDFRKICDDLKSLFSNNKVEMNELTYFNETNNSLEEQALQNFQIEDNDHLVSRDNTFQSDDNSANSDCDLICDEYLFLSDSEDCISKKPSVPYYPVWICHSRPRIAVNGKNRGCYSKYFDQSKESSDKILEDQESYLSKRQQRRARHHARVLAAMKENRKLKKLRRKQKLLDSKENEDEERKNKVSEEKVTKKQKRQAIKLRLLNAQNNAPKICIDLGYSSTMSEKDLGRLASQLRRLYGSNRNSEKPFHLFFCNFSPSDSFYKTCLLKNEGFSSYVIDMVEKSPEDLFTTDELVYLSPDSENILTSIDSNKVYVIGGIVDNSVTKGLSLYQARKLQAETCRLPLLEHLERVGETSGSTVLTVNQVFDVLLKFYETNDWVQALCTGVPSRKGFRIRSQIQSQSELDKS